MEAVIKIYMYNVYQHIKLISENISEKKFFPLVTTQFSFFNLNSQRLFMKFSFFLFPFFQVIYLFIKYDWHLKSIHTYSYIFGQLEMYISICKYVQVQHNIKRAHTHTLHFFILFLIYCKCQFMSKYETQLIFNIYIN